MNTCPITYEPCRGRYSARGLRSLARGLWDLEDLPWDAGGLRREAAARADKLSIQGIQPKLSARLNVAGGRFEVVDRGGRFILKPPVLEYAEVPENEDLTMRLAAAAGIDVPQHALVYAADGSMTYVIRRFDRTGRNDKLAVEDFSQLTARRRDTKYDGSVEQLIAVVRQHCTFPAVDLARLYRRVLFAFLVGNEDMHLKNYSLITVDDVVRLSPAYDQLNSTIALPAAVEETALPLRGRKRNLTRRDFTIYLPQERMGLTPATQQRVEAELRAARPSWDRLIDRSFLSNPAQDAYRSLVDERFSRLFG